MRADREGNRGMALLIPNFSTWGRWVVNFRPWSLYRRERTPSSHATKVWVGPSDSLDISEKRKSLTPKGIPTPDHPAVAQSLHRLCYTGSTWQKMLPFIYKYIPFLFLMESCSTTVPAPSSFLLQPSDDFSTELYERTYNFIIYW